jgi:probable DNA metabolism protein
MEIAADSRFVKYIHIIDGSFEALMTSVFVSHAEKRFPDGIFAKDEYQQSFCETAIESAADAAKSERVIAGVTNKLGGTIYDNVWTVYYSNDPGRYTKISRYLAMAFAEGPDITERLTDRTVMDVFEICRNVGRETNKLAGFIRFSVMENGVQFAQISPEHNQIPLLMQHFADRLQEVPFVIYDSGRKIAGIYDAKEWYVADARGLSPPKPTPDEEMIQSLWRTFYKSIAIESRINPKLQRNLMPKRYWRNMTEHN